MSNTGTLLDHRTFDAFGGMRSESSATNGDRYAYTGMQFDYTTGLQYNRARWYDPGSQRWMERDPIEFEAGDGDLYRYVGNNAINAIDPTGTLLINLLMGYGFYKAWSKSGEGASAFDVVETATIHNPAVTYSPLYGVQKIWDVGWAIPKYRSHGLDWIQSAGMSVFTNMPMVSGYISTVEMIAGSSVRADDYGSDLTGLGYTGRAIEVAGDALFFASLTKPGQKVIGAVWDAGVGFFSRFRTGGAVAAEAEASIARESVDGRHLGNTAKGRVALQEVPGTSCFVAGTPLLTPGGDKRIEEFKPGDQVLSRSEHDSEGPTEAKVVEEVFVRVSPVLTLQVAGREIRTTAEHPFYVKGVGWRCAKELRPGDELLSHDGDAVVLDAVGDLDTIETVYNLRVADYHTYFVGCQEWGFSVWAHNACFVIVEGKNGLYLARNEPGYPAVLDAAKKPITGANPDQVVAAARRLGINNTDMEAMVLTKRILADQVKGNSKALGNALNRAKEFPSSPADEASHLVPGSSWSASGRPQDVKDAIRDARFILNEAGIPLDDARNGFWATSGQLGTHTNDYFRELGTVMNAARKRGGNAVETALADLKARVKAGEFVPK